MMLSWKIRYLDRKDKQFKDRYLWVDPSTLGPVSRAAIELIAESSTNKREILKYRHLFVEYPVGTYPSDPHSWSGQRSVGPSEYLEDETGKEITDRELGPLLTGSPTARLIPRGARPHDIEFMGSEPLPIPIAEVTLEPEEVRLFGYFVRDLNELTDSAFMKDSDCPARITWLATNPRSAVKLETTVTDDEIRSFVTIFRRLYMTGDPASFLKMVALFTERLGDHPRAKWVSSEAAEYGRFLDSVPDFAPFVRPGTYTFTAKRLIDVFLYTQYAHQPDGNRQRQFNECLAEVQGEQDMLTFMFLTVIWKCGSALGNAGRVISWWLGRFCECQGITPDVLDSLRNQSDLGTVEKEHARRTRLFREKTEEIAAELWKQNGRPEQGPALFLKEAENLLSERLRQ